MSTPVEVLCKGFPAEFAMYLNYCRGLRFEEAPDYMSVTSPSLLALSRRSYLRVTSRFWLQVPAPAVPHLVPDAEPPVRLHLRLDHVETESRGRSQSKHHQRQRAPLVVDAPSRCDVIMFCKWVAACGTLLLLFGCVSEGIQPCTAVHLRVNYDETIYMADNPPFRRRAAGLCDVISLFWPWRRVESRYFYLYRTHYVYYYYYYRGSWHGRFSVLYII